MSKKKRGDLVPSGVSKPNSKKPEEITLERSKRINFLLNSLLQNPEMLLKKRTSGIIGPYCEKFELSEEQAKKDLLIAKDRFNALYKGDEDPAESLRRAVLNLESVILRAREFGDLKEERQALKDRDTLKGLYIDRTDITSGGKSIDEIKVTVVTRDYKTEFGL